MSPQLRLDASLSIFLPSCVFPPKNVVVPTWFCQLDVLILFLGEHPPHSQTLGYFYPSARMEETLDVASYFSMSVRFFTIQSNFYAFPFLSASPAPRRLHSAFRNSILHYYPFVNIGRSRLHPNRSLPLSFRSTSFIHHVPNFPVIPFRRAQSPSLLASATVRKILSSEQKLRPPSFYFSSIPLSLSPARQAKSSVDREIKI